MGDRTHNPDRYFGYDRPEAVGLTTYQTGTYDEAIYHRYGIAQWETATGEAAYQYAPVEQSAGEVLYRALPFADSGGTVWYPMSETCNIDRMYAWVAHMSNEWTYALSVVWDRAADLFARTSRTLRLQAEGLAGTWQSPAAGEFLLHVGAALASLDDWRDAALDNASGLRAIAEAIRTGQEQLPPLYERYLNRVELLALRKTLREAEAFAERGEELDESHSVMDAIRREALTEARQEFHNEAVQYTKPIADAYTDVQFTRLGQGRRYEGPLLPDGGATRASAAMSTVLEILQRRIDGAMAGLPGLGAVPMAAPPMPDFVPPPALPSTVVPEFIRSSGPVIPGPPAPLSPPAAAPPDGVLAGAPSAPIAPPVPTAPTTPSLPAPAPAPLIPPALPGLPPAGLPSGAPGIPAPPRGAAPALPGATAPPGMLAPQGPPGAARRPGTHAGRPAGTALPGAIPPGPMPAAGQPGRATGRTTPPGPVTPRLPGATAVPGATGPTGASRGAPPPPTLPGQSTRPSGASTRSASPSARSADSGTGRTGGAPKAAPALPGSTASRTGSASAGPPALSARGAADRSRGRAEKRRPEDVLHVPGQADDALWTVDPPKDRLAAQRPKPEQTPPAPA